METCALSVATETDGKAAHQMLLKTCIIWCECNSLEENEYIY